MSFLIIIFILLLWMSGIFYGFAASLQEINESEVTKRAVSGDKKAVRIEKMLDQPQRYINAIPILVSAAGICAGGYVITAAAGAMRRAAGKLQNTAIPVFPFLMVLVIAAFVLVSTLVILSFRRVGTYQSEKFAFHHVNVVHCISMILYPLTRAAAWLSRAAAIPFGVSMNQKEDAVTEEEIISMVDEAHEQGVIEENEAEMIQNIISFNETIASDIMTHRKDIVAFDETSLLSELVDDMLEEGNSRYPVYRENVDNIVGVVHYKDALKFFIQNSWAKFKPLTEIPGLIRNATFIPGTRGLGDLFHLMQEQKVHMAIVVDEYGQTAGIVTLEDILEEIVGEILDEYDEEEARFRTQKDNSVLIDGLTPLHEVEEELDISFGDTDFETLNGVLTAQLGHIPSVKDLDREFEMCGYRFRIVSLGKRTVGKVRADKLQSRE